MRLSTKQHRQYRLAIYLAHGEQVSVELLMANLGCSAPTFTRDLRELQSQFHATVTYRKASHSYQLTKAGKLTSEMIEQIKGILAENVHEQDNNVSLVKPIKKSISISLDYKIYKQLNLLVRESGKNRSEIIEALIRQFGTVEQMLPGLPQAI